MPDRSYSEDERRQFYRCMTRIFQMERELGGNTIDAIILRAAAIGRLEDRPMSVSSLATYVNLPRQTVIDTTDKARRSSLKFANDAIAETVEFVRGLDNNRP